MDGLMDRLDTLLVDLRLVDIRLSRDCIRK